MNLRIYHTILFCLCSWLAFAQNPEGFEKMADRMASKDVPLLKVENFKLSDTLILLDAREKEEYQVSHIPGAIWVGYDDFDLKRVKNLNRNKTVIVYCSVGYRSGKVGEELLEAGFDKVFNLYGGMFAYVNDGQKVVSPNGKATDAVHGYNKNWSKWLNTSVCEPTY